MTSIADAPTIVSTSKLTGPTLSGPGATAAPIRRAIASSAIPGIKNSQRGLNSNRKRK